MPRYATFNHSPMLKSRSFHFNGTPAASEAPTSRSPELPAKRASDDEPSSSNRRVPKRSRERGREMGRGRGGGITKERGISDAVRSRVSENFRSDTSGTRSGVFFRCADAARCARKNALDADQDELGRSFVAMEEEKSCFSPADCGLLVAGMTHPVSR